MRRVFGEVMLLGLVGCLPARNVDAVVVRDAGAMREPCAVECTIDAATDVSTCPRVVSNVGWPNIWLVEMYGRRELELQVSVCSPSGWVFHLADSESCNGFGGDATDATNEAELYLRDHTFTAYKNADFRNDDPNAQFHAVDAVPDECSTTEIHVSRAGITLPSIPAVWTSTSLFQIDPLEDGDQLPDSDWFLGLNRVTSGSPDRVGSGLQSVSLCFRDP